MYKNVIIVSIGHTKMCRKFSFECAQVVNISSPVNTQLTVEMNFGNSPMPAPRYMTSRAAARRPSMLETIGRLFAKNSVFSFL